MSYSDSLGVERKETSVNEFNRIKQDKISFLSLNFHKSSYFFLKFLKVCFSALSFVKCSIFHPSIVSIILYFIWPKGMLTQHLTSTRSFYFKTFGHVAHNDLHILVVRQIYPHSHTTQLKILIPKPERLKPIECENSNAPMAPIHPSHTLTSKPHQ